jgi:hypothetical protein
MRVESIIDKSKEFTEKKIRQLERALNAADIPHCAVVANGSYARREASAQSDFDYFILHPTGTSERDRNRADVGVRAIVQKTVGKLPSADGVFGSRLELGDLSKNIGGMQDDNANITRRVLFLIEGVAINNRELFEKQRELIDILAMKSLIIRLACSSSMI